LRLNLGWRLEAREELMRIRTGVFVLAAAGLCGATAVLACGDKFLVAGRGARFQKGAARAPVLIYAPLSSTSESGPRTQSMETVLRRSGYRPGLATSAEELGRILADTAPGVVIVDVADAPTVARLATAAPPGPVILPILINASRQELKEARKAWGVALKAPASSDSLLDAVDDALQMYATRGKLAEVKR
jgi:hypothetical protein